MEAKVFCCVCKSESDSFLPYGTNLRANARCPKCGSLERHRLLFHFLENRSPMLLPQKNRHEVLHFAAEQCLQQRLRTEHINYHTADLFIPTSMFRLDITNLACHSEQFDFIISCHLFEHVIDDIKAMSELFRVLKPLGNAYVQVPLLSGKTYENPTIVSEVDREKHFGQKDHVRWYGLDIEDRFKSVGFYVERVNYIAEFTPTDISRFGFMLTRHINIDDIIVLKKY